MSNRRVESVNVKSAYVNRFGESPGKGKLNLDCRNQELSLKTQVPLVNERYKFIADPVFDTREVRIPKRCSTAA